MPRSEDLKAALGSFAAGVTIVTTVDAAGVPQALTATAFSSVSLEPPLCLVCIDRRARAHLPLLSHGCFAVNLLSAEQEGLAARCAAPVADRLAGVRWRPGALTACPIVAGGLASLECRLVEVHAGGDHDILLGSVLSAQVREGRPLVYWRGHFASLPAPSSTYTARSSYAAASDG